MHKKVGISILVVTSIICITIFLLRFVFSNKDSNTMYEEYTQVVSTESLVDISKLPRDNPYNSDNVAVSKADEIFTAISGLLSSYNLEYNHYEINDFYENGIEISVYNDDVVVAIFRTDKDEYCLMGDDYGTIEFGTFSIVDNHYEFNKSLE